jgi:branched-chain amino acid aminotransferase
MTQPLAFLNGSFMPQSEAALPLHDAGFVMGVTVTDLCRTFRHRLYRWPDHLARFRRSCEATDIAVKFEDADITRLANDLVQRNCKHIAPAADLAVVLFATPGPIGSYLGLSGAAGDDPTFGMHTVPLPFERYRPWIAKGGARLRTPPTRQVPIECVDPHIKQRSRMHWWLAAKQVGTDAQALLLDVNGHVTETASSNFILVRNETLISPRRECILEGISMNVLAELAAQLQIPMEHRDLTLDDCYAADEALLTCTSYCIAGVGQLNHHVMNWPGPMLRRLVEAWNKEVGIDIHRQILDGSTS